MYSWEKKIIAAGVCVFLVLILMGIILPTLISTDNLSFLLIVTIVILIFIFVPLFIHRIGTFFFKKKKSQKKK